MKRLIVTIILFLMCATTYAQTRTLDPLNIEDAPIKILNLFAKKYGDNNIDATGIEVRYRNNSDKTIVAIEIKFIMFDVFREYYDTRFGIVFGKKFSPSKIDSNVWRWPAWIDEHEAFNYFVCIEKVMFDDDTIWVRSDDSIFDIIPQKMNPDAPLNEITQKKREEEKNIPQ